MTQAETSRAQAAHALQLAERMLDEHVALALRARATELLAKAQEVEVRLPGPAASAPTLRASGAIAELITRSETDPSNTTEDYREQRIRTKAFYIWLDEGCPEGRAEAHWDMATELMAIEDNYAVALKPVQDGPSTPAGEPVGPLLAIENAGEFPTLTDQGEESTHPHRRGSKSTSR
ncbi:MAG: DUF2934 domain-containing protein [Croceibacterium sp.]|jgi:hypothetical protein